MAEVLVDSGHVELINDVAVDFYGARFATASSDGSVRIFEVNNQSQNNLQAQTPVYNQDGSIQTPSQQPTLLSSLMLHEGPAFKLSWAHPSFGALLASAGYDGKLILLADQGNGQGWDILHFIENTSPIITVDFIPSEYGLGLVYGSCDGFLHFLFWCEEIGQWSQMSTFAHQGGVYSISFAPSLISTNSNANNNGNGANGANPNALSDVPIRQHHQSLYFNSNTFQQNMLHFVTAGHDNCAKVWNFDLLMYKQQFQQQSIHSQAPMLITPSSQHTGLFPSIVTTGNANQQQLQPNPNEQIQYDQFGNPIAKPLTSTLNSTHSGFGPFFTIDPYGLLSCITLSERISTTGFVLQSNPANPLINSGNTGTTGPSIHPTNEHILDGSLTTHKEAIRSVLWIPTLSNNANDSIATIVTCSDDGYVSFWALQSLQNHVASKSPTSKNDSTIQSTSQTPSGSSQPGPSDDGNNVPIVLRVKHVKTDELPSRLSLSTDGTIVSVVVGTDSVLLFSQTNNYNQYEPESSQNVAQSAAVDVGTIDKKSHSDWVIVDTLHGIEYINTQVTQIKERLAYEKKQAEEAQKRAEAEAARKAAEEAELLRQQQAAAAEQLRQQQATAAAEQLRQQQLAQQQQLQQQAQQLQQQQQAQQQAQQHQQMNQYGQSNQQFNQYGQQNNNNNNMQQQQYNQYNNTNNNPQQQQQFNQYQPQQNQQQNQPQQYNQYQQPNANMQSNQYNATPQNNQFNQYQQPQQQQFQQQPPQQNQQQQYNQYQPQNQPQQQQYNQYQPQQNQQQQYNQYQQRY